MDNNGEETVKSLGLKVRGSVLTNTGVGVLTYLVSHHVEILLHITTIMS